VSHVDGSYHVHKESDNTIFIPLFLERYRSLHVDINQEDYKRCIGYFQTGASVTDEEIIRTFVTSLGDRFGKPFAERAWEYMQSPTDERRVALIESIDGTTALHYAVRKGHLKTVKFLVRLGASVTFKAAYR
jgi:hypothetical protein